MRPALALIAAVAANGVIGRDGKLPWRLPEDLRHFRALTTGHAVIMGRRTWESLPHALPERQNIVVTRQPRLRRRRRDRRVVARRRARSQSSILRPRSASAAASCTARRCRSRSAAYMTEIARAFDGDATFPALDPAQWRETAREPRVQATPTVSRTRSSRTSDAQRRDLNSTREKRMSAG